MASRHLRSTFSWAPSPSPWPVAAGTSGLALLSGGGGSTASDETLGCAPEVRIVVVWDVRIVVVWDVIIVICDATDNDAPVGFDDGAVVFGVTVVDVVRITGVGGGIHVELESGQHVRGQF